ncbi:uncharacterized protein [Physcomitrium patens]|uniref:uncharacterized protein n=1 Tax=Physcomitrium patens TaxID=3218 RepID=UPI003CCDE404
MTPFVEIAQSRYKSRVGLLLAVSRVPSCGRKGRTGFYASHCNVFGAEGRRGAGGAGGGAGYGRTTPCAVSSSCRYRICWKGLEENNKCIWKEMKSARKTRGFFVEQVLDQKWPFLWNNTV